MGQKIFSCKLGIVPFDILTEKEIDLISEFDSYSRIKKAVVAEKNNIILTLLIAQFSNVTLIILPSLIIKINVKKNVNKLDLKLESLYATQLNNEDIIKLLTNKNRNIHN